MMNIEGGVAVLISFGCAGMCGLEEAHRDAETWRNSTRQPGGCNTSQKKSPFEEAMDNIPHQNFHCCYPPARIN